MGTVLLGAALVLAPIYAFTDRMTTVSALGIAGIAFLLAAWAVRKIDQLRHGGDGPADDDGVPPRGH